jgi:iron complex outermembrane receptor protein
MPGSLTLGQALNTPEMANPGSVSGDHQRNVRSLRVANKTAMKLEDGGLIEFGGYAGYKRLFHPIFQVIDQRGPVAGFFVRYRGESTLAGLRNVFTLGGDVSWSEVEAKRYTNAGGSRSLPMTSNATQTASNQRLYAENQLYIADTVALVGGVTGVASQRKLDDRLNPANSDDTSFNSLNPKVGLLWDAAENTQFYANVSRSYEPPTFTELVQGAGQYVPLDPQRAVTFEAGTRGASASIAWDVALYHARVKGELVNFTVGAGIPASTFNADETIHQGIEASLTLDLGAYGFQSALPEGSRLLLEQAYTYSDFHFEGDTIYGDNKLAGMPPHVYVAALRYKAPAPNGLGWDIAPKIEWVPEGGYVDYANTLEAPGYATIGIEGGVDITKGVRLFVDARNLTDKKYISTYTAITDARVTATDVFYPGEGRSVFAGLKIAF